MDNCYICNKELHSISTRRIGDYVFCIECGDSILEVTNDATNEIVSDIKSLVDSGAKLSTAVDVQRIRLGI